MRQSPIPQKRFNGRKDIGKGRVYFKMDTWDFWKTFKHPLDKFSAREVQRVVTDNTPSQLNREPDLNDRKISRFLFSLRRMPKAWNSRPWTPQEMARAGNAVSNDLFRRKMKRDLGTS